MYLGLARLTALAHFTFIAFLIGGAPAGIRWRELIPVHVAAIVVTLVINLTGSDCPLTVLEKRLLNASGRAPYANGFISHYLVEPVHAGGIDGRVNLVLLGAWIVPTALAYSFLGRHAA
jgi:hypothetical protein